MAQRTRSNIHHRGFSLTELLISIAIIGILSAIAIPVISRTDVAAREEVANQTVTTMNRAVTSYRQNGHEFTVTGVEGSGSYEQAVMALLTVRDEGVVGTPFLQGPQWPSVATNDAQTYRARWNGRFFEVLPRGTEGTGLKINGL